MNDDFVEDPEWETLVKDQDFEVNTNLADNATDEMSVVGTEVNDAKTSNVNPDFADDTDWETLVSGEGKSKFNINSSGPYKKYTENWVGKWARIGFKPIDNPAVRKLLCETCFLKMTEQKYYYHIDGETILTDKYDWSGFQCTNDACWGSYEQYLQIKRQWRKQADFSGYEYMFTNNKIMRVGYHEECLDRTRIKMRPGNSKGTFFEGLGFVNTKSTGTPCFGYPKLIDKGKKHTSYLMHATCHQTPRNEENLYSQTMVLEHFQEEETSVAVPKSYKELSNKHQPVALTYMEMYPFAAGCRMLQFKFLRNEDFQNLDKSRDWLELHGQSREERYRRLKWEGWMTEWKKYIEERGAFIEGQQDGWAGPIISYWARVDDKNGWFGS